jgi:DNA-binding PadR family transcriptional regulator
MSLRHALLAVLTAEPMTGYDLVKFFDGTVAYFWSAPHSQVYPELRRMEQAGLITATVVQRGERAQKRVYAISDDGKEEMRRWVSELHRPQPERNLDRLKAAHFEWGSYDSIRRQLQEHLNRYTDLRRQWQQMVADLESRHVPLLRRRLENLPPEQHEPVVAFRRFAFSGQVALADAEIAWARQGLAMIDELEQSGAPLLGEGDDGDPPPGT